MFEKCCDNCINTHSWNGCGRFDVDTYCNWWKDMFDIGKSVEIRNPEFEFSFRGEPTGEYARGAIRENIDNLNFKVQLYCNGKLYNVKREWMYLNY